MNPGCLGMVAGKPGFAPGFASVQAGAGREVVCDLALGQRRTASSAPRSASTSAAVV